MPLKRCTQNGRPGFKWSKRGKCYTYKPGNARSRLAARRKALRQARAIIARTGRV